MPNVQFPTPKLNERQIAHRRAMLDHLAQSASERPSQTTAAVADDGGPYHVSVEGDSNAGTNGTLDRPGDKALTPRNAMDTIAMDER